MSAISSISLVHILPTFVISDAHFDSILDFCYLPQSQLLVSSSLDHTIKVWDPVACPYGLTSGSKEAFVRVRPGVYRCPQEEFSKRRVCEKSVGSPRSRREGGEEDG